ncbi:hypothetical protein ACFL0U_02620 [Pseudomonadota bacterium]
MELDPPQPKPLLCVHSQYAFERQGDHISIYELTNHHKESCGCESENNIPHLIKTFQTKLKEDIVTMEWLDCEARKKYEVYIDGNGKLHYTLDSFELTSNHEVRGHFGIEFNPNESKEFFLLFVLSSDNKLYIAPNKRGVIQHSSLVAGEDINCAGLLTVKGGRITELFFSSGHYQTNITAIRYFLDFVRENMRRAFDESFQLSSSMGFVREVVTKDERELREIQSQFLSVVQTFGKQQVLDTLKWFTDGRIKRNPKRCWKFSLSKELAREQERLHYDARDIRITREVIEKLLKMGEYRRAYKYPILKPEVVFTKLRA